MRSLPLLCALLAASPALANDSIAELGVGGLILSRSDVVAMEKEVLSISMERVEVDYVFRNRSDADVETIVAFPMPDIVANPYSMPSIPHDTDDDFLGFEVHVDGASVAPELEQRAKAVGLDVTRDLLDAGVPLYPHKDATHDALAALPEATAADWVERGIITIEEYDDGSGWKRVRSPFWSLSSTYWWRMNFPAGEAVEVSHRYLPSVGASAGLSFFLDGKFGGDSYPSYKAKYCMDESFERAVAKIARESGDGYPRLTEHRVSYVLTTGGNWATGTIGDFTLTIDKGDAKNLVSFCAEGVKKIGPTTFQVKATDFYPSRDLDILILKRTQ